jgi:RimJ/RimL family protein N-acetyltransferase
VPATRSRAGSYARAMRPPPYRIETERLVVRCWEPRDAPLLKEAVDESIDHLRPWMPWAHLEPRPLDEKVELLRRFRGSFDLGTDFVYGIFSADDARALGGSGLHTRAGDAAFEIGYWVRTSATGNGYVTEAVAALTQAAFAWCGADRVEIRVDPENEPSLRVARRLGYVEEARLRRRQQPLTEGAVRRDFVVFSLLVEEAAGSPAAAFDFRAYDAAGRELPRPPGAAPSAGRTARARRA